MNIENRLVIIDSMLNKLIMDVDATWDRDRLIESQQKIKQIIWSIKKHKEVKT